MIDTVSDFIEELKIKGLELIKKYEIVDHPVLIGDMYEGLTKKLLDKAVFKGLNLKIVGGKIRNSNGDLSGEIDCMVVEGNGEEIPFTEKFIYHFYQVIAVIEVKKTLYSNTLEDSYSLLKTVIDVSRNPEKDGDDYIIRSLRDSWKSMLRTELPRRSELKSLPEDEQYIYHTLLMEAFFPIRIVFGYFGFKTEYSLREAFADYLGKKAKNKPAKGYGAGSIPNLIICGKNSIIKNNGMPYAMPFRKNEFYWPLLVTAPENPIRHLLELIWTRLSYKYNISSSIFGADDDCEFVHEFIYCKLVKDEEGNLGWAYNYSVLPEDILNKPDKEKISWSPIFLTDKQYIVVFLLIQIGFINYRENLEFIKDVTSDGTELQDFLNNLIETGLVYKRNNEIRLLTDECQIVTLPDGRICAGENKSGELIRWIEKNIKKAGS